MPPPPQTRREWFGNVNAHQKAVWMVLVHQQMKDFAAFVEKLWAEWAQFTAAVAQAVGYDTATLHTPNSDTSRVATRLLEQMQVWAHQRFAQLETMWHNTHRYTVLMYELFDEAIKWPNEDIDSLTIDVASNLEAHRGHPDDDDADRDQRIRDHIEKYVARQRRGCPTRPEPGSRTVS